MAKQDKEQKPPKVKVGLKIAADVDQAIRDACDKHGLHYIDIVERGAGKLARSLLKQPALKGLGGRA